MEREAGRLSWRRWRRKTVNGDDMKLVMWRVVEEVEEEDVVKDDSVKGEVVGMVMWREERVVNGRGGSGEEVAIWDISGEKEGFLMAVAVKKEVKRIGREDRWSGLKEKRILDDWGGGGEERREGKDGMIMWDGGKRSGRGRDEEVSSERQKGRYFRMNYSDCLGGQISG